MHNLEVILLIVAGVLAGGSVIIERSLAGIGLLFVVLALLVPLLVH